MLRLHRSLWLAVAAVPLASAAALAQGNRATELILRPIENRIYTLQQALEDIERRTLQEMMRTELWIREYTNQAAEVDRLTSQAIIDASIVQGRLADSVGWVRSHARDPNHAFHSPDGDMTTRGGEVMASAGLERLNQMRAAMASGEFLVESVILGPTRRKIVEQKIQELRERVQSLQKGLREGTLPMRLPGLGVTKGSACRAEIESLQKQLAETRARIGQGEYQINVPGLGWHSRKSLQALIARNREEIAAQRKAFNEKTFTIERSVMGIFDHNAVEKDIAAREQDLARLDGSLAAGAWKAAFPNLGWRTGAELRAATEDIDRQVAGWDAALAKGEYRAPIPYVGNLTEKDLKDQIAQLLARATPDHAGAAKLQDAIPEISTYAALRRAWWLSEAGRLAGALERYPIQFEALRTFREQELADRYALRSEFERDLSERMRQLEHEIRYFEDAIENFIPR